jgi:hypothetical protein
MVSAGSACSERGEEHRGTDIKPYGLPSTEPAPPPTVENAAPLSNAEGYPEQARNTMADEEPGASDWHASAELKPLHESSVRGDASLEEVGGAVRVQLQLDNAPEGPGHLSLQREDCDDVAVQQAPAGKQKMRPVARVNVESDGQASVMANVRPANLRPDADGSLLGQALVYYGHPREARGEGTVEVALACAPVRQ